MITYKLWQLRKHVIMHLVLLTSNSTCQHFYYPCIIVNSIFKIHWKIVYFSWIVNSKNRRKMKRCIMHAASHIFNIIIMKANLRILIIKPCHIISADETIIAKLVNFQASQIKWHTYFMDGISHRRVGEASSWLKATQFMDPSGCFWWLL